MNNLSNLNEYVCNCIAAGLSSAATHSVCDDGVHDNEAEAVLDSTSVSDHVGVGFWTGSSLRVQ